MLLKQVSLQRVSLRRVRWLPVAWLVLLCSFSQSDGQEQVSLSKPKLILDCDTANEIDDLYAILRMLRQDRFDVQALNSTQWIHYLAKPDSVGASQKMNEKLVGLLGRKDLPTLLGSREPMGKPWGGETPKDSPAARFMIKQALALPPHEKLYVVCTGATTNLASAIKLEPKIAPRIKAYILGFRYNAQTGVWNKSEFNVRRDLNAADFVLNRPDLELHIMSGTVSRQLVFDREDSFRRQARLGEVGAYLTSCWNARFPDSQKWVMWDVALVEALLRPELAAEKQVMTPPENRQRKVWMYDRIDAQAMKNDFWQAVSGRSPEVSGRQ